MNRLWDRLEAFLGQIHYRAWLITMFVLIIFACFALWWCNVDVAALIAQWAQ